MPNENVDKEKVEFMETKLLPLNLQFFADGDDDDPDNEPDDNNPDGGDDDKGKGDDPDGDESFSKDYVEKLRKEAAKYRNKAKEKDTESQDKMKKVFEALGIEPDPEKEFDKQLTEAQQRAQEAENRANSTLKRAEIKAQAAEVGIVDGDVAFKLLDQDAIKINDDGEVEGTKEALESLVKQYPFLKKDAAPNSGGGDFSGGGKPANLDAQIKEAEEKGDRSTAIALKRQKFYDKNQK